MPLESAFRRRFEEYNQILRDLSGEKSNSTEYQAFLDSLSALNDKVNTFYRPDQTGTLPRLTVENVQELRSLYTDALTKTTQYIAQRDNSRLDRKRAFIAEEFHKLLERDMEVVSSMDENTSVSLEDAFRHSRTIRLDISGSPTSSVGGALSSRIPVSYVGADGKPQKGFFTAGTTVEDPAAVIRKYHEKYPQYAEFWDVLQKTDPATVSDALTFKALFKGVDGFDPFVNHPQRSQMASDPDLKAVIEDFGKEYTQSCNYAKNIAASVGSSVEERNCAMSAVASMLGQGNLLARSQKATLLKDGIPVQGSIMSLAEGCDLGHIRENDPLLKWGNNTRGNKQPLVSNDALRQMADLQVLDFICGNIDRHNSNVLYHFDTSDPEHPVLSGIVGIDNDYSFGTYQLDGHVGNEVPLDDMLAISESTADRVMAITGDGLDYVLKGFNLSEAERQAAQKRLDTLQQKILDGKTYFKDKAPGELAAGKLRVIPDNEFQSLELNRICNASGRNLFYRFTRGAVMDVTNVQNNHRIHPAAAKGVPYAGAVLGSTTAGTEIEVLKNRFAALKTHMDDLKQSAVWNSSEFKEMHQALTDVLSGEKNGLEMQKAIQLLQEKTQNYIKEKRTVPRTEKGRERLHLARELADLCVDGKQELAAAALTGNNQPAANYRQQMAGQIRDQRARVAESLLTSIQTGDQAGMTEKVSELVCLSTIASQLDKPGNGNLMDLLEQKALTQQAETMRPMTERFLKSVSKLELTEMLQSRDGFSKIQKSYLKEMVNHKMERGNRPQIEQQKAPKSLSKEAPAPKARPKLL